MEGASIYGLCAAPFACSLQAGGWAHPRGMGQIQKLALTSFLFPSTHFLSRSARSFARLFSPRIFPSVSDIGTGVSCIRMVASSSPRGGLQGWGHSQGLQPPITLAASPGSWTLPAAPSCPESRMGENIAVGPTLPPG